MFCGKYNYPNSGQNSLQNIMEDNLVYIICKKQNNIVES